MRYSSLDVIRTLAIADMILVHFLENLSGDVKVVSYFAGFGAPLFAFLAGLSFRIWYRSMEARGLDDDTIRRIGVRRGIFLFFTGFLFNFFVWLPEDLYNWDVLTMIGTALIILSLLARVPRVVFISVCIMILCLSPFIRLQADYPSYWVKNYYDPDNTIPDILMGYLGTGYFPLFPWLIFPLAGYIVSWQLFPDQDPHDPDPAPISLKPIILAGLVAAIVWAILYACRFVTISQDFRRVVTGWTMFPASLEYVMGVLTIALILIPTLHYLVDRRAAFARIPTVLNFCRTMSQHSFTIYILHHVLHLWPLWFLAMFQNRETTHYWANALSLEWSAALAPVCFLACYLIVRLLALWSLPTMESAMRWFSDDSSVTRRSESSE
jgi:hypothetical protein